jgi:hypothetical protein
MVDTADTTEDTCLDTSSTGDILLALAMCHAHSPGPFSTLPRDLLPQIANEVRAQQAAFLFAAGRVTPPATPRAQRPPAPPSARRV